MGRLGWRQTFDAYCRSCGARARNEHFVRAFGGLADQIVSAMHPARVLDAGCGIGLLVEALRTRGVDAEGVDLSSYAIGEVPESLKPFCTRASIADEFTGRYDLIVSIEVVEHMPAREAEAAVANMCRHADDVLFSSSPIDQREPSHVNVQPPEHWAELFARHGFYRDVDFDASFITPWAARFRRSGETLPRIVRGYERRDWALAFAANEARQVALDVQRQLAEKLEALAIAQRRLKEAEEGRESAAGELTRARSRTKPRLTISNMNQRVLEGRRVGRAQRR